MLIMHNPVASSGPWSLGVLIGTPIAIVLFLAFSGLAIYTLHLYRGEVAKRKTQRYATTTWGLPSIVFAVCALITVVIYAASMWPYHSEFHQWRSVTGTVQQISSRMVSSDKSMSQRYVVVIDGEPFAVDDTRASLLHKGDKVSLKCKKEYQFQAVSGWACNWN